MFPLIINIIQGILCLAYFIFYYNEHFTTAFSNPKYYIYSVVALFVNVLGYYIIKTCPNPAYFRVFVSLQIIILFLATLYITKKYEVSTQSIMGIIFACLGILLISLDKNNK
jgi:drug/metabolite transporter (DMT)-like permease